jgi:hypothetical protein
MIFENPKTTKNKIRGQINTQPGSIHIFSIRAKSKLCSRVVEGITGLYYSVI